MATVPPAAVHPGRIRRLKSPSAAPSVGRPVIYWMFRDQRHLDNHALNHALHLAHLSHSPVAVFFNLFPRFLGAHARHLCFMIRGLRRLRAALRRRRRIPLFLFRGDVAENLPRFVRDCGAAEVVTDFTPLREVREWKGEVLERLGEGVGVWEVDAHNVVPVWVASGKLEYSARTIRGKIQRLLPEYLVEFPELCGPDVEWSGDPPPEIDWEGLIDDAKRYLEVLSDEMDYFFTAERGDGVAEVDWCEPGEEAAMEMLMGSKDGFLSKRIKGYVKDRNNPTKPKGLSCLSPYLHFGQISAQRCALEARALRKSHPQSVDAFLEELIIRRELADNFCYYQPLYDSLGGAWEWARNTLMTHASDKRDRLYSKEDLESGRTADPLWNASQLEMVHFGKMHGYMRMYWAKKILEWTRGPEEALSIAIYLNDKYELDGRDPSGYVGCMWSICGVHDQGWKERPIFGKIRYMNYEGCKRKFDVDGYIAYVKRLVDGSKKRTLADSPNLEKKKPKMS